MKRPDQQSICVTPNISRYFDLLELLPEELYWSGIENNCSALANTIALLFETIIAILRYSSQISRSIPVAKEQLRLPGRGYDGYLVRVKS